MPNIFQEHEVHLRDYLYILRKRRGVIVFFFLLSLMAGGFFSYTEDVIYKATATILIEKENPNVVDFKEVMAFDASTTDYYQTQYQMLKSRSLAKSLVQFEKLNEDVYLKGIKQGRLRALLNETGFAPIWIQEFLTEPSEEDVFIHHMLHVNPIRNSRLVDVSVQHPSPVRAAEIVNSLVKLYVRRNIEDRFVISQQATDLISDQISELKTKVGDAERKIQLYKEEYGIVKLPSIREKNEFLQEAKFELVKIQAEESKLAKRYLPAHPKMIHIRSQIEGLQEKIEEEEQKILGLGQVAIEYAQLEREAESATKTYAALLQRLEETTSEAKMQASNILVVDHAETPNRPYKPRPFLNMLISFFFGITGGIILAFFFEYLNYTVKIPDDIEKGLGLELLGVIPKTDKGDADKEHPDLFFNPRKHSPAAESVRALRTALLFKLRRVPGARTIMVTSPNPEEGKSSLILNLAYAFRQNNLKVILIDTDLRKPKLQKMLGVEGTKGITDVLEGVVKVDEVVHRDICGLGFDFLSCGTPSHHPTELLGNNEMISLMEELKKTHDIILLDSPPFLAVADVTVMEEYTNAVVVIARYQKTDKRQLKNLRRRLNIQDPKVFGVVLNQVSIREKDHYYHQYYYYGYGDAAPPK